MPLNIATAEFTPFLKYDAKSGRFKVKADAQDQPWVEIRDFTLAFDMANIRTGWIHYPQDGPPHKVWSASVTSDVGPRPGPEYKLGFEVPVFGNLKIPNTNTPMGLRTWSSNAFVTVGAINDMYAAYEKDAPANPGKVPLYAFQGVKEITMTFVDNHGIPRDVTVYKPIFGLQGWIDRNRVAALDDYQKKQVQVLLPPSRTQSLPSPNNGRGSSSATETMRNITPQMQRIPTSEFDGIEDDIPF